MSNSLEVAVIGGGPSGILAAEKLLGTRAFDAKVTLFEKGYQIGGIPSEYSRVQPNSPFKDLYEFLMELRAENVFSDYGDERSSEILEDARNNPSLGCINDSMNLICDDLLEQDDRFDIRYESEVKHILELGDGRYRVVYKEDHWEDGLDVDVVISATGAKPKKNPFYNICRNEIELADALNGDVSVFNGRKVIIAGASHSGAIAFVNAVNQGAKEIEVWHRGNNPFKPHTISDDIKYFQFTGINDPTLSRLNAARGNFRNYRLVEAGKVIEGREMIQRYKDWSIVSAVGFEPTCIDFIDTEGNRGKLSSILQEGNFGDFAPRLCYPGTRNPIPRIYGLGIAYPLTFTSESFLSNSVEENNAGVVGIYFTNTLTKKIVSDILKNV